MDESYRTLQLQNYFSLCTFLPMTSADRSSDPAVETHGLTKRYGDLVAVDRLDLRVETGTVVALLGPNGAGKTTTVRMIATLVAPTAGTAVVGGHDVVREGDAVRRRLSLTGQFAALDQHLTGRENVALIARLRGHTKADAGRIADQLIERFDATEFGDQLIGKVSGGQRRRIDLAASLVHQPSLLVLDEPTTGLDPRSRQVVWATVRELVAEGVTLLLTTQYLEEADALADRIVLIDHGREVAAGTAAELKSQVGEQRIDVVAVDTRGFEQLRTRLTGDFDVSGAPELRTLSIPAPNEAADLGRVAAAVGATGVPVDEIALRRPSLDDAFLALTGKPAQSDDPENDPEPQAVAA
jgi:daunorubicin resistance ABC transporter ATP-binding subunit